MFDASTPHARLESLTIRRYRHLREPVTLRFGDGTVLLIGRNGAGKTNLLRLLDAVTRLDFRDLDNDPHGLDIDFVLGWGDLRLEMTLVRDADPSPGARPWSYHGVLGDGEHRGVFRVENGHIEPAGRDQVPDPAGRQFRMHLGFFVSPSGRRGEPWMHPLFGILGHTGFVGGTGRFDEALGGFESITSATALSHASFMMGDLDGSSVVGGPSLGTYCPRAVSGPLVSRPREDRVQALTEREVPFFGVAARTCGFAALTCEARIDREERRGDHIMTTYGPFAFRARLADGTTVADHDFSFGQKRIVSFFWHLACVQEERGVIVADELVNGMHHAAVAELVGAIVGLQAFIAGQNPLLFDHMEYTSADDFRSRVVCCVAGPDGGWHWQNPSEAESQRFFLAHDVGYQHVHEILKDEGLW